MAGASYTTNPALGMPSSHEPGQVNFSFYVQYSLNARDYLWPTKPLLTLEYIFSVKKLS